MVGRREVLDPHPKFEKEGGNGNGAKTRLADVGIVIPNYDSKITNNERLACFSRIR